MINPLGTTGYGDYACPYCGERHATVCKLIRRIELKGSDVVAVELHPPQVFAVERADGDLDVMVSGSYDDVVRYERLRALGGGDLNEEQYKKRFGSKQQ